MGEFLRDLLGDHVDDRVGQLPEVGALLVAVNAPRVGLIQQLLQFDVGHRGDQVEQRREALADLGGERGVLRSGAEPGQQQHVAGRQMLFRRDERCRRRVQRAGHGVDLRRHCPGDLAGQPQRLPALVQGPEEQPDLHDRADLVQGELE
jgi:hypothetical protein